jgi:hypothetical protein
MASLSIAFALTAELTAAPPLAAAAATSFRVLAVSDNTDCEAFQRWFARQPGSQLILNSTSDFYKNSVRPRKPDTVLDYSAFPLSHDQASWYKAMKHYRNNFGNGRCLSGFYDSAHNTAVLYSQYGTASDLTVTTVSSAPAGLPNHPTPDRTRNGVRLGMTLEQVTRLTGRAPFTRTDVTGESRTIRTSKRSLLPKGVAKRRPSLRSLPTWASYS